MHQDLSKVGLIQGVGIISLRILLEKDGVRAWGGGGGGGGRWAQVKM